MARLTQLGRYKIESHLGTGAFADVYKALDQTLDRKVALKVLKPTLIADGEAFARFVREAKITANLFHPHIATVLDMGEADGHYYLAMRFVDGTSLDKVLTQGGDLSWDQALNFTSEVAEALEFAHKRGLVHRDVKPQNILISEEDGAVLTDFGLVRAVASSGMTSTGSFLGTPAYMAPEIWEGADATPASDQYALACVFFEMLTGKVLFDGRTPPAVMAKHFKPVELPRTWAEGVPDGISGVLAKALAKIPGERYPSVADFLKDLRRKREGKNAGSPTTVSTPAILTDATDNPAGIEWVEIPAGELVVGSRRERRYVIRPFLIAKYPISNAQYQLFVDAHPNLGVPAGWDKKTRSFPLGEEDHPVTGVATWDVKMFCEWARCRLPTDEEWIKAARGTYGRTYPWGEDWVNGKYCNTKEAGLRNTTPVREFAEGVSPDGVWDMCGNVWERVGDGWQARGGSWNHSERQARLDQDAPTGKSAWEGQLGFRPARSL